MGKVVTGAKVDSLRAWIRGAAFSGVDTKDSVSMADRNPVTAATSTFSTSSSGLSLAGLTAAAVVALPDLH